MTDLANSLSHHCLGLVGGLYVCVCVYGRGGSSMRYMYIVRYSISIIPCVLINCVCIIGSIKDNYIHIHGAL